MASGNRERNAQFELYFRGLHVKGNFQEKKSTMQPSKSIGYESKIHPPSYWTTYTKDKTVEEWRMGKGNHDYNLVEVEGSQLYYIKQLVEGTWVKVPDGKDARGLNELGTSGIKVTKVERIENLQLYETYRQNQQNLLLKAGKGSTFKTLSETGAEKGNPKTESYLAGDLREDLYSQVNEGIFFHGTKRDYVEPLEKDGIDIRLAGKGLLGRGIYMAERSTKSDQYADKKDERRKNGLKMFLVRCSLGDIHLMKSAKKFCRPPCCETYCLSDRCAHDKRYDSVVLEDRDYMFREFVVYDRGQTYPEYLITYDRV